MMKLERITEIVLEKAGEVNPNALRSPATDECLTPDDIAKLVGDQKASDATLRRIAQHVGECERCQAVLQLTMHKPDDSELEAAAESVSKAIQGHLESITRTGVQSLIERAVTIVLQWLPGEPQPQLATGAALADETDARTLTLEVSESPAYIRLDSPEGTPDGAEIVLEDSHGEEVFRGETNPEGIIEAEVPPGTYQCTVEGYEGPLLFGGEQ